MTSTIELSISFDAIVLKAKEIGLSRSRLCRRAGVHETTVARNLNGQTKPNTATVAKLHSALLDILKETT